MTDQNHPQNQTSSPPPQQQSSQAPLHPGRLFPPFTHLLQTNYLPHSTLLPPTQYLTPSEREALTASHRLLLSFQQYLHDPWWSDWQDEIFDIMRFLRCGVEAANGVEEVRRAIEVAVERWRVVEGEGKIRRRAARVFRGERDEGNVVLRGDGVGKSGSGKNSVASCMGKKKEDDNEDDVDSLYRGSTPQVLQARKVTIRVARNAECSSRVSGAN